MRRRGAVSGKSCSSSAIVAEISPPPAGRCGPAGPTETRVSCLIVAKRCGRVAVSRNLSSIGYEANYQAMPERRERVLPRGSRREERAFPSVRHEPLGGCGRAEDKAMPRSASFGYAPRSTRSQEIDMHPQKSLRAAIAIAATGMIATAAAASVDTSRKPGGVYLLKPGIFVAKGSSCREPANAAIRQYDGKGISTAHSRSCIARIVSHRGSTYEVSQTCIDAGAGPAPRVVERQTVAIQDALTFSVGRGRAATTYRYCPIDQLPADLRKQAR